MVGESPWIPNPLKYGQNKQTDLILRFLFRSLLQYKNDTGNYEGDIANCDISDLSKVSCTLKDGFWSDGTKIQVEDVIATVQAFRANPPNDKMRAFLAWVSVVSKKSGIVELVSKEKNSLMLDILTYPILRSDMIERIRTERFSWDSYLTSGAYIFLENEKNAQYGYDRVTLAKNAKNPGEGWLDKYNFLFFPDASSLERWAENLGIIVPPVKQEQMLLGPRFAPYEYTLLEYLWFFLNTDRVSSDVRKHIILQKQSSISWAIVRTERPIGDLFATNSGDISSIKLEKNLADVLALKGYKKPDEKINSIEKETGILTGASIIYENNIFIDTPSKKNIVFTEVADGTITISGRVPGGVKNIVINGYTLKEFTPGNPRFSYKVSLEGWTLIEGKNTYTLEFETFTGVKSVKDTLTLYYYRDGEKLKSAQNDVEKEYLAQINTPELVAKRLAKVNENKAKIRALDPRYYYDDNLNPFELEILYLGEPASLKTYAGNVSDALMKLSIKTKTRAIETKDLTEMLKKWEKNYDGIIVWFEASGHFSHIAQIFLSTEAKNGINFAKIESKTLDALFAAFRVSYTQEKALEVKQKIQEYIKSEAFFFPISSPIHTLYVDKNLKWIQQIDTFQDITTLYSVIKKTSIKQEYILNLTGKSFSGFFSWVWNKGKIW